MATIISDLIPDIRSRLIEPSPSFWTDEELLEYITKGCKDLWRSVTDLKQEHYLIRDTTHVTLEANTAQLSGVPLDVHKVYMIEPLDLSVNGSNHGLLFKPLPYNNNTFQLARSRNAIDPQNDTIYYDIFKAGAPVGAPEIVVAPKVSGQVTLNFVYIPTLPALSPTSRVPIPGEADNALIAWAVAYARSKEREDRSPDPAWLGIYATEKGALLQSLGLRQYQEPTFVEAMWTEYWGLILTCGLAAAQFLS